MLIPTKVVTSAVDLLSDRWLAHELHFRSREGFLVPMPCISHFSKKYHTMSVPKNMVDLKIRIILCSIYNKVFRKHRHNGIQVTSVESDALRYGNHCLPVGFEASCTCWDDSLNSDC